MVFTSLHFFRYPFVYPLLCKRILGRIWQALWLVVADFVICHSYVLKYFEYFLSEVSECYGTMVRIILLYQYVTVEASHFVDGKYADSTEGLCSYIKYFTLSSCFTFEMKVALHYDAKSLHWKRGWRGRLSSFLEMQLFIFSG